jgi:hypothetical protein
MKEQGGGKIINTIIDFWFKGSLEIAHPAVVIIPQRPAIEVLKKI